MGDKFPDIRWLYHAIFFRKKLWSIGQECTLFLQLPVDFAYNQRLNRIFLAKKQPVCYD